MSPPPKSLPHPKWQIVVVVVMLIASFAYFKLVPMNTAVIPPSLQTPEIREELQSVNDFNTVNDPKSPEQARLTALFRLVQKGDPDALKRLLGIAGSLSVAGKVNTAHVLALFRDPESLKILRSFLGDPDHSVRESALQALPIKADPERAVILNDFLSKTDLPDSERMQALIGSFRMAPDPNAKGNFSKSIFDLLSKGTDDETTVSGIQFAVGSSPRDGRVQAIVSDALRNPAKSPQVKTAAVQALKYSCPVDRDKLLASTIIEAKSPDLLRVAVTESVYHPSRVVLDAVEKAKKSAITPQSGVGIPFDSVLTNLRRPNHGDICARFLNKDKTLPMQPNHE
jgi:hypothetical protein